MTPDLKVLVLLGLTVAGPVVVHLVMRWRERRREPRT